MSSHVKHAATTAMALSGLMLLSQFRRDAHDLRERAAALASHCAEHGIGLFGIWGRFSQGLARSWNGDPLPGIEAMRVTMETAERVSAGIFRPMHLGFLAETYACIGERERARELLDEGIARAAKTSASAALIQPILRPTCMVVLPLVQSLAPPRDDRDDTPRYQLRRGFFLPGGAGECGAAGHAAVNFYNAALLGLSV